MARGPTPAERLLLPEERQKHGEKVFVAELAAFLGTDQQVIHRFARAGGGDGIRYGGVPRAAYMRPREAQRVMVAVRAWQGQRYAHGLDHHVMVEAQREADRLKKLRAGRFPKGPRPLKPLVGEKWTPPPPKNTCDRLVLRRSRGCRSTWYDPRNGHTYAEWEGNPLHVLPCNVWVVIEGADGDEERSSGRSGEVRRLSGACVTRDDGEGGRAASG